MLNIAHGEVQWFLLDRERRSVSIFVAYYTISVIMHLRIRPKHIFPPTLDVFDKRLNERLGYIWLQSATARDEFLKFCVPGLKIHCPHFQYTFINTVVYSVGETLFFTSGP